MRAALEDLAQTAARDPRRPLGGRARRHARARAARARLPRRARRGGRPVRRRPAGHGRAARRRDRRALRRRGPLGAGRRRRGRARARAAAPRRRRAGQGLARRRASSSCAARCRPASRRRARRWRSAPDGLDLRTRADRGHRLAAAVPVPQPEVHRVPAPARVRPEHPRGGTRGPQDQGRHADDGRDHHLARVRDPVPDPVDARLAVDRGVRRRARVRAARLRRRLHEDRQAPLARAAGADQAGRHDRDLARAVVGRDPEGRM